MTSASVGHADTLDASLGAALTFFEEHPDVPTPVSMILFVEVKSRAELDGLAGDFGLPAPKESRHYRGGQFYVHVRQDPPVKVIISYTEDPR